ncbi:hypothetical protein [Streptomyces sp. NPDC050988]|uniref:hypothetical protein n=1 Tax=Streptomyces sp. NPDC050988 TaxID=3365637 RepID=UPI003791FEC5
MTTPPRGHRDVIEAALTDWWITTDPSEPFHSPAVAEQVETYLLDGGYVIAPDTRKTTMPKRRTIIATLLVALICCTGTGFAAADGRWTWAAFGATVTVLLVVDAARDHSARRHARDRR